MPPGEMMRIATSIIGFDSAWTDKPSAPGAICAIRIDKDGITSFEQPRLSSFASALGFIRAEQDACGLCIVAIDQPTIVPNLTSLRPVERVAASLVNFCGGGVQPSNRSKIGMFCDNSPIWAFKAALGAIEEPETARTATQGLFIMEVFPALALPAMEPAFFGHRRAPRYNPARRSTFRRQGWADVINLVRRYAVAASLDGVVEWSNQVDAIEKPRKADQDRLDAVLCALVGFHWRHRDRSNSVMIGDLVSGYMIAPTSPVALARLRAMAKSIGVPVDGRRLDEP